MVMRRGLTLLVVAAMFVLSIVGTADATGLLSPDAGSASRAQLTGVRCVRAVDPSARSFSVTAVMRPVSGTRHMNLQFDLLQKSARGSFVEIGKGAPGLDSWLTPTPPTLGQNPSDVWTVQHPVDGLPAPDTYRFRVEFRWRGRHGRVLELKTLHTSNCYEPDLLPDLEVTNVVVQADPHHPKKNEYVTTLKNAGATGAGPFLLQLSFNGIPGPSVTVKHIGAHATKTVTLIGPVCTPGGEMTVNPNDTVEVSSRQDDSDTVLCPSSSGG
jgi:hypothetical protein